MKSLAGANMARGLSIQILSAGSSWPVVLELCTVEDELVAAFSRLDVSAMIVVDLRIASEHWMAKNELEEPVLAMPLTFDIIQ
jgi:hypothetical protein